MKQQNLVTKEDKRVMFDLQLFNDIQLASDDQASQATVGKDYLLYINTGTVAVPVWTPIGGQRGASLDQTAEEIDVSDKTTGGYSAKLPGMRSWSMELDGLLLLNDKGIEALRIAYSQNKKINIKLRYPDNTYQVGWAVLTGFPLEAPHDGEATLSGTLSGNGPLSNIAVKVSKAAPADQTFYFEESAVATAVKNAGGTSVVAASYQTKEGQVTLKSDYLKTLVVGEHLFHAELSIGGRALLAVIITE